MALVTNSFSLVCTDEKWQGAQQRAEIRINSEYKRDARLNTQQRIEKIAIGYIGEFAFQEWCQFNSIPIDYIGEEIGNTPDNGDFLSVQNIVIDIKTQEVSYIPQDDWRCEVTDEQRNRPADIYVFSKLFTKSSNRIPYMVGWMTKKDFLTKAVYREKGTILRGKPVHYPKWDVTILQLNELNELVPILKKPLS